jgi:hypothetical protein
VLFVTELLQSLGNGHANERQPRRHRSRQHKIKQEGGSHPALYDCFRDQCWNRVTMLDGDPRGSRHSLAATPKRHCTR